MILKFEIPPVTNTTLHSTPTKKGYMLINIFGSPLINFIPVDMTSIQHLISLMEISIDFCINGFDTDKFCPHRIPSKKELFNIQCESSCLYTSISNFIN